MAFKAGNGHGALMMRTVAVFMVVFSAILALWASVLFEQVMMPGVSAAIRVTTLSETAPAEQVLTDLSQAVEREGGAVMAEIPNPKGARCTTPVTSSNAGKNAVTRAFLEVRKR
ncbi:hypothetical protein [Corynebacterium uterequi]|uniref:Uncharacterized protein n=1 Tax=Corynebacterium uterequi TaxID=1072256 RepID=A0A0G3HER9_9CORY|nr:hypothetical protein [Corynebacterium uterequi]AKK11851.1 hypothetical protein CUTER_09415 [Corynebacterium uterequi]